MKPIPDSAVDTPAYMHIYKYTFPDCAFDFLKRVLTQDLEFHIKAHSNSYRHTCIYYAVSLNPDRHRYFDLNGEEIYESEFDVLKLLLTQ